MHGAPTLGEVFKMHNDPSSATRPTGRNDCNQSAMAGFAAAHCWTTGSYYPCR
jgi:hypothetical protein